MQELSRKKKLRPARLTKEAMAAGVQKSGFLVLFLSEGVLTRPFVQYELEIAAAAKKSMLLIHEMDSRHHPFDFQNEVAAAPKWIQELIENHESLPWQRRGYLREAQI